MVSAHSEVSRSQASITQLASQSGQCHREEGNQMPLLERILSSR